MFAHMLSSRYGIYNLTKNDLGTVELAGPDRRPPLPKETPPGRYGAGAAGEISS